MGLKKSAAVVAAEQLAEAKSAELKAAQESVRSLEREYAQAVIAAREAQEHADAALPQCDMVNVRRYDRADRDACRVVIVRKTPTGMLVVRHVGYASGSEYKFKWATYGDRFMQAEKQYGYGGDRRELRNVPPEYLPVDAEDADDDSEAAPQIASRL